MGAIGQVNLNLMHADLGRDAQNPKSLEKGMEQVIVAQREALRMEGKRQTIQDAHQSEKAAFDRQKEEGKEPSGKAPSHRQGRSEADEGDNGEPEHILDVVV